ncbi:hypothetical protein RvY_16995 [Ramazzottius varieornatus]|uniref:Uncharacterized protein n=1 Tax=Ramazzottius varieornatus TaxID=947166 RepID=A0A1D1W0J0_RAMVA|nr:hypothetical protein RvY_16995 [Ramazzottius varieornatus]
MKRKSCDHGEQRAAQWVGGVRRNNVGFGLDAEILLASLDGFDAAVFFSEFEERRRAPKGPYTREKRGTATSG